MLQTAQDVFKEAAKAHLSGDLPRAEYLYCRLISHDDERWELYAALGSLYAQAGASGRAIAFLRQAVELGADALTLANLAAVYSQAERRDKALVCYEKALTTERHPRVLSNLAGCYINQGSPEKALQYADEALAKDPDLPEAGNHRALALLELGRFSEGFAQYDSRLWIGHKTGDQYVGVRKFHRRPYEVPMWNGEATEVLAIHGEQGLGDEIMFLTCIKQIVEKFSIGRIVIECAPRLVKLLSNSLKVSCYGTHEELVAAEKPTAYIPMGSLPRFIWPVVPNAYLKPTGSYPRAKREKRIGISWFGGSIVTHSHLRNAPAAEWRPILELGRVISLQYGEAGEEAKAMGIPHDSESIADLDRLAAMILSCDLVVSVCNTTVHMAGALGVPCIVLVPSKPAWRYGLSGDKMVWYDSPYMVRQVDGESWSSVFQRAKDKCADFGFLPRAQSFAA